MVFDHKARLLSLVETEPGRFEWQPERSLWVCPERQSKTNLFSKVGLGAVSILFSMHPQALTLHQAIEWEGRHYFLTAIDRKSPILQEVTAAEVQICTCIISRLQDNKDELKRPIFNLQQRRVFPATLTEKYIGHTQLDPHAQLTETFVLVTPKVIELEAGELVYIGDKPYAVLISHCLDPYKNEYEVSRKEDA